MKNPIIKITVRDYGEMTAEFPVSMLCEHPDALIRMTEFVANLED